MKKFVLIAVALMGLAAVLTASPAQQTVAECNSRACAPVLPSPIKG